MKYSLCSLMCVEKELCSGNFKETMNRKNQSKCLQDMENSYQLKPAQDSYYSKHSYNQEIPTHLSNSFLLPKSIFFFKDRFLLYCNGDKKNILEINDEDCKAMISCRAMDAANSQDSCHPKSWFSYLSLQKEIKTSTQNERVISQHASSFTYICYYLRN